MFLFETTDLIHWHKIRPPFQFPPGWPFSMLRCNNGLLLNIYRNLTYQLPRGRLGLCIIIMKIIIMTTYFPFCPQLCFRH